MHAIAIPPGPHGERRGQATGVQHRLVHRSLPQRRRRGPREALQLPRTEAAGAGDRQCGRFRRRRCVSARKADEPVLGDRAHTCTKLGGTAPATGSQPLDLLHPIGPQREGAACGALGQALEHQPPQRRRLGSESCRVHGRRMAPGTEAFERLVDGPLHDLLLVPQLRGGCHHVALHGRMDLAQRREDIQAQAVAGDRAILVGLVLAPGEAGLQAIRACVIADEIQQRPHDPVTQWRHAEQRTATRRGHQPVENGLDLVAAGVPGRHQVETRPLAHGLGRPVARSSCPSFEVSASIDLDALDVEPYAEVRAQALRRTARPAPRRAAARD